MVSRLPAVTIGIPFYNAEKFLLDAIRSVFAQTYKDWELILIDDGSTDRSLDIAMSVDDPRVRVISDGHNRRLPYRLNQIVAEAQYDYVARMDADDLMARDRIERQVSILMARHDVDIVSTGVCSITNDGFPVGIRCVQQSQRLNLVDVVAGRSGIVHASVVARRSWFLRNPYDTRQILTEDYELWLRAYMRGDLRRVILADPLYFYREDGNVTASKMLHAYASQRSIIGRLFSDPVDRLRYRSPFYMKSLVAHLADALGLMWVLRRQRVSAIDRTEEMSFVAEIKAIRGTKVPGLD
ncbi:MAG TPA: glycosyltransferase family 2 protein [Moraxellaceae bacterium]|nr:glycosyltransferase family 2 protein [Moraxellaceae bacterium]